jgi:hypothetical protein
MKILFRWSLAILLCVPVPMIIGCSDSPKPESATSFMGHVIGESSMAWAAEEKFGDIDPLSKCQEIIRSPVTEQSLASAKKCHDFVDRGSYLIDVRDPKSLTERFFRFTNWRLSMIVVQFADNERSHIIAELDSHFANDIPGRSWHGKDRVLIEVQPVEQLNIITGNSGNLNGFLVVVSDPGT